jgi:hypothetical protein
MDSVHVSNSICRLGWAIVLTPMLLLACDVPTGLPRIESSYLFPVEDLAVPVTGIDVAVQVSQDLSSIDLTDQVRGATIRISPENPTGATGTLAFTISGGGVSVNGTVDVAGPASQSVELDEAQTRALLGGTVQISASGTLCRAGGCGLELPPFPVVTLRNEIQLRVRLGGEG